MYKCIKNRLGLFIVLGLYCFILGFGELCE